MRFFIKNCTIHKYHTERALTCGKVVLAGHMLPQFFLLRERLTAIHLELFAWDGLGV